MTDGAYGEGVLIGVEDGPRMRELSERLDRLRAELQHRTRNLMTVVQALANETARSSRSLETFSGKFSARLGCLARAQGLLSRADLGERLSFGDLAGAELSALGSWGKRVALDGRGRIALPSRAIQTLALTLHELAANAVEHGALSQDVGRLTVAWGDGPPGGDGRPMLRVAWTERGVRLPPLDAMRFGFGRELIEQALPFQLGASTTYGFAPDGVRCVIVLPIVDDIP